MPNKQNNIIEEPFVIRRLSMDALADVMIDEIYAETKNKNLFHKTKIIVPNRSIQRYIFLRFAHRHDFAAQLEFPLLMSVFHRYLPQDDRSDINEKTIGWRIYRILQDQGSEKTFPVLARWINGDSKRLYDLSRQLGKLYDKYILYRPWWINDWEDRRMPAGLNGEQDAIWQGELWRCVAGIGGKMFEKTWKSKHFAAVFKELVPPVVREQTSPVHDTDDDNMYKVEPNAGRGESGGGAPADPGEVTENSGETIRIFGFSQLAPAVLQCLEQIQRSGTTVKVYHLVPSREYYADCVAHKVELNRLLNNYFHEGQNPMLLQRDLQNKYFQRNPLLASFAMQNRVLLNNTISWPDDTDCDYSEESEEGTILQRLQKRIWDDQKLADKQPKKTEKGKGCRSIQIRNCYSAFREVETAHIFILHCLDEDHELQLKSIFIMSPTPEDYAPLVDAVFNHSNDVIQLSRPGAQDRTSTLKKNLGVTIADLSPTERLSSYNTMMKVLSLFKGDFTTSEVFGILQDQALLEQWGITQEDCQYCLTRAMQAGIRWGWDEKEHERAGGKAFLENSWQAGLDRMLLDYALDADSAVPYQISDEATVFPVPGFDGGRAELLGKFYSLTSKLHEIVQIMRKWEQHGVPFEEWKDMLSDSAGYLFGGESQLKILLNNVLSAWQKVLESADTEDIPLTSGIVLAYLQDKHVKPEDNTKGFMRGKITFCGLRPMRSIPADVILLLGMNHRAFPEEDDNREFDIMQQYRKNKYSKVGREPGDPLKRDESRQLFLDTIMAARKYLYISYVGRDIHDRQEKPPSVCVDELRNYLTQEFGKYSFIELKDPLHSFSPELFVNGVANQSFSARMREAARLISNQPGTDASDSSGTVEIEGGKPVFDIRSGIHPDEHIQLGPSCQSIELEDLRWFFVNPAEKHIRNRLDARLSVQETVSPEDSEPFESNLDWDVKDELFRSYCEASDRSALKRVTLQRLKANGSVPLMQKEDDWKDWADMARIVQDIEACTSGMKEQSIPAEKMDLDYSAADLGKLAGLVYDTVPDGTFRTTLILPELKVFQPADLNTPCIQTVWSLSELSGFQLIGPILNHVRANLVRKTVTRYTCFSNRKKGTLSVTQADAIEQEKAKNIMKRFLCLYHAGMRKPLPFFPRTSYKYYGTADTAEGKKESSAKSAWNSNKDKKGEVEKFGNYFGTELQINDCFKGLAEAFFGSVVFHLLVRGERKKKK